jgi:rhodanese-related sulfurtransferase
MATHDPKRVPPKEAYDLLNEGYQYLDVRTEEEFDEGHPAGAVNVPYAIRASGNTRGLQANPNFVDEVVAKFTKTAKLVVGCKSGGRSLNAARTLLAAGFVDVVEQRAGWDGVRDPFGQLTEPGWSRVGLP